MVIKILSFLESSGKSFRGAYSYKRANSLGYGETNHICIWIAAALAYGPQIHLFNFDMLFRSLLFFHFHLQILGAPCIIVLYCIVSYTLYRS